MFMKRGAQPPPLRRQTSAERALARANQRLQNVNTGGSASRDREDSSDNEDDINKYLSSLRKKTQDDAPEAPSRPGRKTLNLGDDFSDISLTDSSEQGSAARSPAPARSKFLKAKPAPQPTASAAPPKRIGTAVGASAMQRSAALAEASRLTGKYSAVATVATGSKKKALKASDSDLSAPSTDSEVRRKKKEKKLEQAEPKMERQSSLTGAGAAETLYTKSSRAKLGYLTDEESASIGKDGGKFLKKAKEKKKEKEEAGELTPKTRKQLRFADTEKGDGESRGGSARSPKSPSSQSSSQRSDRLRRSPAITDSDEEMSTAELGEGLLSTSSAPLTPQSPKRRPSLRSPDTPRSPKKRVTIAEAPIPMSEPEEEEEEIGEAVMDISELSFVPEQFAPSPPPESSSSSSSSSSSEKAAARVSDTILSGRVETIMDAGDFLDSASDNDDSSPRFGAIRSIEELSSASSVPEVAFEAPSAGRRRSRSPTPPSGSTSSSSTSSTVIRSEQRAVTSPYSDSDFESVSETERPTTVPESYAADFESSTSRSDTYTRSSSSSSEETTITESYTTRIRRRRRRGGGVESDKSVQTHEAGLEFRWDLRHTGTPLLGPSYGMAGVDLSPIAQFAVSPEALEAVTAYSPSVIALNNMLRQQIELTRNFVATQRRLYDAMARTIAPDFLYTTLEDTKEYIRRNRPPSLTMEEALREVELDI